MIFKLKMHALPQTPLKALPKSSGWTNGKPKSDSMRWSIKPPLPFVKKIRLRACDDDSAVQLQCT